MGIPGSFSQAEHGNVSPFSPSLQSRKAVCRCEAEIIMHMNTDCHRTKGLDALDEPDNFEGRGYADRIGQA